MMRKCMYQLCVGRCVTPAAASGCTTGLPLHPLMGPAPARGSGIPLHRQREHHSSPLARSYIAETQAELRSVMVRRIIIINSSAS